MCRVVGQDTAKVVYRPAMSPAKSKPNIQYVSANLLNPALCSLLAELPGPDLIAFSLPREYCQQRDPILQAKLGLRFVQAAGHQEEDQIS